MDIYHLSHTDLDGYGAQILSKACFEKDSLEIYFSNANYGREVEIKLIDIINRIKKSQNSQFLILITDLNLTPSEAAFLQNEVNLLNLSNKNIKLQLLDHHITGKECANNYDWYYLDPSICATKLTFNFLAKNFDFRDEFLEIFSEMVNAADTWREDNKYFQFGKVAMNMISQSREFNRFMFDNFDRDFKFSLLHRAGAYFLDSNNNLIHNGHIELDNNIFLMKKIILNGDALSKTMDDILSTKLVSLLNENKENYTIYFNDKKGLLTYMVGNISNLANAFLSTCKDYDFFMDLSSRGAVSLRSCDRCDVSEICKLCFNGGGHKNAAGGRFDGFKETFLYPLAKEQVVNFLSSKEKN